MSDKNFIISKILLFVSGIISFLLMFYCCLPIIIPENEGLLRRLQFPRYLDQKWIFFTCLFSLIMNIILFFVSDYFTVRKTKSGIESLQFKWVVSIMVFTSLLLSEMTTGFLLQRDGYFSIRHVGHEWLDITAKILSIIGTICIASLIIMMSGNLKKANKKRLENE